MSLGAQQVYFHKILTNFSISHLPPEASRQNSLTASRKMQIKVKCSCEEGNCPEWAIVELQGVVEAQPHLEGGIQNLQIGVLCRPSSQESYTFTVGYHELTGTKVKLKKPLLVLKKIKQCDDAGDNGESKSSRVEMDVIGIIRQRILFKTRPRAVISNVEPAVKEKKEKVVGLNSIPPT